MGLATAAAVQTDNETLVDRLFQQGQIKKRLLCIKLHYKKISLPSELIIGGCDVDAKYWLPVVRNFLWTITLNKIVLTSTTNGSELLTIEPNAEAIIDTGGNIGKICDLEKPNDRVHYVKNKNNLYRYANRLYKRNY